MSEQALSKPKLYWSLFEAMHAEEQSALAAWARKATREERAATKNLFGFVMTMHVVQDDSDERVRRMSDYEPKIYRKDQGDTPFGMPHDVYWDITEGATERRGQWAVDNILGVTRDEVKHLFVMQDEEVDQLRFSPSTEGEAG